MQLNQTTNAVVERQEDNLFLGTHQFHRRTTGSMRHRKAAKLLEFLNHKCALNPVSGARVETCFAAGVSHSCAYSKGCGAKLQKHSEKSGNFIEQIEKIRVTS
jgi:hypothetical protein